MNFRLVILSLIAGVSFISIANAQEASVPTLTKEQCLACHGPTFDDLNKKNVQAPSDSGPVNPHVWIPHAGGPDKNFINCTDCHTQHEIPPKPGHKDSGASLEPCYACHHNFELKKCSSYHSS